MNVDEDALTVRLGIERRVDHTNCHKDCDSYLICPKCKARTAVWVTHGRWDEEGGHTAMPYEPVAVTLMCRCEIGDMAATGRIL